MKLRVEKLTQICASRDLLNSHDESASAPSSSTRNTSSTVELPSNAPRESYISHSPTVTPFVTERKRFQKRSKNQQKFVQLEQQTSSPSGLMKKVFESLSTALESGWSMYACKTASPTNEVWAILFVSMLGMGRLRGRISMFEEIIPGWCLEGEKLTTNSGGSSASEIYGMSCDFRASTRVRRYSMALDFRA